MSEFSLDLLKLESWNFVCTWTMSCCIENQTHCSYSSLNLSIFLSFHAKFVSQVSQILYKKESSNMVYICNMGDCIMGSRFRDIAHILLFFI